MLDWLKSILQNVLIWLLLLINGGKLPPELLPPVNIPDIDWSSLAGQTAQWQQQSPLTLDGANTALAARKAQLPRSPSLPDAGQAAQQASLAEASLGAGSLAVDRALLVDSMASGVTGAIAALDPSAPIVNPSGVPRELLGAVYPWRSKGNGRAGASPANTQIVEASPQGSRAGLALMLVGAGGLAVAGYVVLRRRR